MRLTPKWTATLEEAFGKTGREGEAGERFIKQQLEQLWPDHVTVAHSMDKSSQLTGADVSVLDKWGLVVLTADVKNNLKNGQFFVEIGDRGWLFGEGKISDVIIHTNVVNKQWLMYHREDMAEIVNGHKANRTKRIVYDNDNKPMMIFTCEEVADIVILKRP